MFGWDEKPTSVSRSSQTYSLVMTHTSQHKRVRTGAPQPEAPFPQEGLIALSSPILRRRKRTRVSPSGQGTRSSAGRGKRNPPRASWHGCMSRFLTPYSLFWVLQIRQPISYYTGKPACRANGGG
ncbi:hypothetical protein VTK26DRAFT_6756 [Humicola hyalothermophila]